MVAIDTSKEFPQRCTVFPETHVRGKKRKRALSSGDAAESETVTTCVMCLQYNGLLFMDFVSRNEMVVVEQPWLDVVATFPDALQRRVYGT